MYCVDTLIHFNDIGVQHMLGSIQVAYIHNEDASFSIYSTFNAGFTSAVLKVVLRHNRYA